MSDLIAIRAKELGYDNTLMNSYKDFYNSKGYFLTQNNRIQRAKRKPPQFPLNSIDFSNKWMNSQWFVSTQRRYLMILAGIDTNHSISSNDYNKIKDAYNKWNSKYYVVFYNENSGYACNLFVGEALYLAGKDKSINGKYLSAKQIWNAEQGLKIVNKNDVKIGDIATFGGYHVEIVTKVTETAEEKISFCSRGAGRGSSDFGTERCDTSRSIKDNNIKFLRVQ